VHSKPHSFQNNPSFIKNNVLRADQLRTFVWRFYAFKRLKKTLTSDTPFLHLMPTFKIACKGTERNMVMKFPTLVVTTLLASAFVHAESILKPINDQGYGIISGRIQSLSMYRDFESKNGNTGANGANSTIGVILGYTTPELAGLDAGLAYNYAGEIWDHNSSAILANDNINVLNEGWVRYRFESINLSNTTALIGRRISNGEVFRADDFRQKSRSIEAVQLETKDISDTRLLVGHAGKMSNWINSKDFWKFNNFGDVFSIVDSSITYDTDGITWGEVVNHSVQTLEVAVFDAYAWDIANLAGTRIQWELMDDTALVGYYRNEADTGRGPSRSSNTFGLSLQQKVGGFSLEPGIFSVKGDDLLFQELTTGINHPLGASLELCSCQFAGDSDTAYIKAVTTLDSTRTTLYGLYNFTWHDYDNRPFDGQELNIVIKQPIVENLSVAFKGGIGWRDGKNGTPDTTDTDSRLFITYVF
jgi:hypothetical protein